MDAGERWRRLREMEQRSEVSPPSVGPRRIPLEVQPPSALRGLPGAHVLPPCRHCGAPLVWRGSWGCDACGGRHAVSPLYREHEKLRRLPPSAWAGVPLEQCSRPAEGPARDFSSGEADNSPPRFSWLDGIEALTSLSRRARAARLIARGARPHADGTVTCNVWHEQRARSLGKRAENWRRCGELVLMAERGEAKVPVEYRCGDWRACPRCRERRRFTARRGARRVREAAMRVYRREMSRYYGGEEGRHSEKLLTLTVRHGESVHDDMALMRRAMPFFMRALTDYVNGLVGRERKCGNLSAFPWYRTYEVAATNELHVHAHIWMLAPFLDHVLLHAMWGRALLRAGCSETRMAWKEFNGQQLPWPVLDIRAAKGVDYTAKVGLTDYVAKADGIKERLAPVHASAAYESLSDMRVAQWAMGWCPRAESEGWQVRRATQAERDEWAGSLSRNLARARVVSAEKDTSADWCGTAVARDTGPPPPPDTSWIL